MSIPSELVAHEQATSDNASMSLTPGLPERTSKAFKDLAAKAARSPMSVEVENLLDVAVEGTSSDAAPVQHLKRRPSGNPYLT